MDNIQREDIESIGRHVQLNEKTLDSALQDQVYPDENDWTKFLKLLFLSLGIGFSIIGIIFFFAYNWDELHKFFKIGLAEALVILTTGAVLWPKLNKLTRQILLTGSAVLVGVLFAVFGQIYQTGANAYDFFLTWTIFVSIWVCIANFPPLWLVYTVLLNTTLILYYEQVADWPLLILYGVLFLGNGLIYVFSLLGKAPSYFTYTVGIASLTYATLGMLNGILTSIGKEYFPYLTALVILIYSVSLWYGIRNRSTFILSAMPFSSIIIIAAFLIDLSDDEWMLLTVSIFIIISVTLVVRNLIHLSKANS